MISKLKGKLEIDHGRGVIYFHSDRLGKVVLRIRNLPTPIPDIDEVQLDITMHGCNWNYFQQPSRDDPEKDLLDSLIRDMEDPS